MERTQAKGPRSTIGQVATANYMVTITGEGAITRDAIEKAIKYLELVKEDYPTAQAVQSLQNRDDQPVGLLQSAAKGE